MTIDEAKEAEIRRLHFAEHWNVGTIVTQLGLHHDVVERVLGVGKGARSRPPAGDAAAEPNVPKPLRAYEASSLTPIRRAARSPAAATRASLRPARSGSAGGSARAR
jgi:hypothetical protein